MYIALVILQIMSAMFKPIDQDDYEFSILQTLNNKITYHEFNSGEIILEVFKYNQGFATKEELVLEFLGIANINLELPEDSINSAPIVKLISKNDAMARLTEGVVIKPNYTVLKHIFEVEDIATISKLLFSIFSNTPKYYDLSGFHKLFQFDFDVDSHCISNGFLIIDDNKIGILWINDKALD
jgi:hypothetical protein